MPATLRSTVNRALHNVLNKHLIRQQQQQQQRQQHHYNYSFSFPSSSSSALAIWGGGWLIGCSCMDTNFCNCFMQTVLMFVLLLLEQPLDNFHMRISLTFSMEIYYSKTKK